MKILIRNLSPDVNWSQITDLVNEVASGPLLLRLFAKDRPAILEGERLRVVDLDSGTEEYWCLLRIRPEKAAHRALKHLNGQLLGNRRIVAKQYIDRVRSIQPETIGPDGLPAPFKERRRNLIIEQIDKLRSQG